MSTALQVVALVLYGLARLLWRFRSGLAPFAFVIAFLSVTELTDTAASWQMPMILGSTVGTFLWFAGPRIATSLAAIRLWLNPIRPDEDDHSFLLRRKARLYACLLIVVCGTWASFRHQVGWTPMTSRALFAAFISFAIPWWHYHGWRRRRPSSKYARRWSKVSNSDLPELRGWQDSKVIAVGGDRINPVLTVRLRGGRTVKTVVGTAPNVASIHGLRPGAVTIMRDGRQERDVRVRIVPRDPWQGVLPHPLPAFNSLRLSDCPRANVGRYEAADNVMYKLQQHLLIVGQTGSGKSVWLESMLAWILAYEDAVPVAADLASGATFGIWQDVFAAPLATNESEAAALVARLFAEITHREQLLSDMKRRGALIDTLPTSLEFPAIFAFLDEFPDLVKSAGARVITLLERFAAKGRKVNVWLILGAQNPTEHDVGSTELRGAMTATVGLGLNERQSRTLWGSDRTDGWDSKPLLNGTFLLQDRDPEHREPRVAKGLWIPPAARLEVIERSRFAPNAMNPDSRRILLGEASATQLAWAADVDELEEAPSTAVIDAQVRRTPADVDDIVFTQLPTSGGLAPQQIMQATEFDRDTINRSLRRLQRAQRASNIGHGKWVRGDNG